MLHISRLFIYFSVNKSMLTNYKYNLMNLQWFRILAEDPHYCCRFIRPILDPLWCSGGRHLGTTDVQFMYIAISFSIIWLRNLWMDPWCNFTSGTFIDYQYFWKHEFLCFIGYHICGIIPRRSVLITCICKPAYLRAEVRSACIFAEEHCIQALVKSIHNSGHVQS